MRSRQLAVALAFAAVRPALAQPTAPGDWPAVRPHGNPTVERIGVAMSCVGVRMIVASPIVMATAPERENQFEPPPEFWTGLFLFGGGAVTVGAGAVVTSIGLALPNPSYERPRRVSLAATPDGGTVRLTGRW